MKQSLSPYTGCASLFLPLAWGAFFAMIYATKLPATLHDPDLLWHLATGRWLAQHGASWREPFSFTAGAYPWLNISWWWDGLLYWLHESLGLRGMLMLAALAGAAVPAMLCRAAIRAGQGVLVASMAAFASGLMITHGVSLRPQLVTLVMLAWLMSSILMRPAITWRKAAVLALLFCLWANAHGGVLLGFLLVVGWSLWRLAQRQADDALRLACALAIAALLTLLLHPLHLLVPAAITRTLGGELLGHVAEWRMLSPLREIIPACWLLLVILAIFYHLRLRAHAHAALLALAACMAVASIRHIPVMIILTALPVAQMLGSLLARWHLWVRKEHEYAADLARLRPPIACAVLALLAMLPVGILLASSPALPGGPRAGLHWLATHQPGAHLWNDYNLGGSILWWGEGRLKPAIDGRAETAYPPAVVADYLAFMRQDENWRARVEAHAPDAVLLAAHHPHVAAMDAWKHWCRAHADEAMIIWWRSCTP
jgi:hypothetical protein